MVADGCQRSEIGAENPPQALQDVPDGRPQVKDFISDVKAADADRNLIN